MKKRLSRRGFTKLQLLGVLALFLLVASVIFPMFARSRQNDGQRSPCITNLKQLGLGLLRYTQDYDEKFPLVRVNSRLGYGWADGVYPYVKSRQIYQCPQESTVAIGDTPRMSGFTDYWMNARLSGAKVRDLPQSASTLTMGDGNDGTETTDARYAMEALPSRWLQNTSSPSYRHKEGAFYGFADGHAKWFKPSAIGNKTTGPTFALR